MNCRSVRKHLDDHVLGELDPALEIQINAHLLACPECSKRVEETESIGAVLAGATRFEPTGAVFNRTKNSIRNIPSRKRSFRLGWKLSLAYAAAFLIGMVLMRVVDSWTIHTRVRPNVEVQHEPKYQKPLSDTVFFSPAPPKNLART